MFIRGMTNNFFFTWRLLLFAITLVLWLIPFLGISYKEIKKQRGSLEGLRAFECGFNAFNKKYLGFCVQFLNIAILFLLVDLEIALLLPFFFNCFFLEKFSYLTIGLINLIVFFLVVLLLLEWVFGGLNWKEDISRIQLFLS